MKLSELRQELFQEFCVENGFPYGTPNDCALIESGNICDEQQMTRFKAIKCVGFCDYGLYDSFLDMNKYAERAYSNAHELDEISFTRLIEVTLLDYRDEEWLVRKLREKFRALFGREVIIRKEFEE